MQKSIKAGLILLTALATCGCASILGLSGGEADRRFTLDFPDVKNANTDNNVGIHFNDLFASEHIRTNKVVVLEESGELLEVAGVTWVDFPEDLLLEYFSRAVRDKGIDLYYLGADVTGFTCRLSAQVRAFHITTDSSGSYAANFDIQFTLRHKDYDRLFEHKMFSASQQIPSYDVDTIISAFNDITRKNADGFQRWITKYSPDCGA